MILINFNRILSKIFSKNYFERDANHIIKEEKKISKIFSKAFRTFVDFSNLL